MPRLDRVRDGLAVDRAGRLRRAAAHATGAGMRHYGLRLELSLQIRAGLRGIFDGLATEIRPIDDGTLQRWSWSLARHVLEGSAQRMAARVGPEDIVQAALCKLWRERDSCPRESPKAVFDWLVAVFCNCASAECRANLRAAKRSVAREEQGGRPLDAVAPNEPEPIERASYNEVLEAFREAFRKDADELPATAETVAAMHGIEGRSLGEIAKSLGISKSTVRRNRRRAQSVLEPRLERFVCPRD